MDHWSEQFARDGMVAVEDALDADFCESVVVRRLVELGVDESDRSTWPVGPQHLAPTTTFGLDDVAPRAAAALYEIVGGRDAVAFSDLSDNLIVNCPDPKATWWAPAELDATGANWHKDGDWFRHFLDSPEQGMLGIVFWRDVSPRQGATYVIADSIAPVARLLAEHPEGIEPPVRVDDIVHRARDVRALTGRQGTVVWAHPFVVHSASVNATDRLRIISNSTVILRDPPVFARAQRHTALERCTLDALGVDELEFEITGERGRIVSERERRWKAERQSPG